MDRKNTKDTQELYAAWGTTREEHMDRMMKFIESLNARVDAEEAAVPAKQVKKVVALKKAAATPGKIVMCRAANIGHSKPGKPTGKYEVAAKLASERKATCQKPFADGMLMPFHLEDGKLVLLRQGNGKPVRDVKLKTVKCKRKK
jgi:hypothetical protein